MTKRDDEIFKAAREHSDNRDARMSFSCGARWADEHPRKGLVDIDKVYKWLEENLHMYNTSECRGDRIAFVEDFKKAMEE